MYSHAESVRRATRWSWLVGATTSGPRSRVGLCRVCPAWYRRKSNETRFLDPVVLEATNSDFDRWQRMPGDTFDERLDALRDCIQSLPEKYRETVLMRYEQGLKPAELARVTHRKSETVKKRLQRAKQLLLGCIQRKLCVEMAKG